jgi:putative chitinase
MLLTVNQLEEAAPYVHFKRIELILPSLNATCIKYGIITPSRIAHFLTQLLVETNYFRIIQEPGSGAEYEGVVALGNIEKGDGRRYIGRGYFKLVGRKAYQEYKEFSGLDIVAYPHYVTTPRVSLDIAGWLWTRSALNEAADMDNINHITTTIVGVPAHLREREDILKRVRKALGVVKSN